MCDCKYDGDRRPPEGRLEQIINVIGMTLFGLVVLAGMVLFVLKAAEGR